MGRKEKNLLVFYIAVLALALVESFLWKREKKCARGRMATSGRAEVSSDVPSSSG